MKELRIRYDLERIIDDFNVPFCVNERLVVSLVVNTCGKSV